MGFATVSDYEEDTSGTEVNDSSGSSTTLSSDTVTTNWQPTATTSSTTTSSSSSTSESSSSTSEWEDSIDNKAAAVIDVQTSGAGNADEQMQGGTTAADIIGDVTTNQDVTRELAEMTAQGDADLPVPNQPPPLEAARNRLADALPEGASAGLGVRVVAGVIVALVVGIILTIVGAVTAAGS